MNNVLEASQICKSYRDGQQVTQVLHGADLRINRGDMMAIVGSSGSGKSTLARLVMGFYEPEEGQLLLDGLNLFLERPRLFQNKEHLEKEHHLKLILSKFEGLLWSILPL